MRADRLVATLLILQRRGRVTAAELARELEVSEKTARRDLEALGMAGLPVYSQAGRGGGWQLLGGASTDLTGLTADEARNLFLAAGSSSTTTEMRSAMRKLLGALPASFRDDAEVAAQAVVVDPAAWGASAPPPPPEHLPALQRAVIERRRIVLGYVDRTRAVSERVADPLGLVSKGTVWYLVAGTDRGRRTFRVSRVRSVVLTDERAERPEGFDLRTAWQEIVTTVGERRIPVRATIRIDASFVPALRGQFGDDMMLAEMDGPAADGRELVIIGGPSTHVIAQHLAGWGGLVEVVEPLEVRAHLVRMARELLHTYGASAEPEAADAMLNADSPTLTWQQESGRRGSRRRSHGVGRGGAGMRLHVVRAGTAAAGAPPIVFVHGLGSSAATWARCMEILGQHHEVVAVDLMGHGDSPVPDDPDAYSRDTALADLDDVLASLDEPAVLVGHSLGGYLSLAHAVTRPGAARAIVVINTGPGFRDPDKRDAWNERSRRNAHKFGVPPQATNLNLQHDAVVMDHLAEVQVPTLVLAGELDRPEYVVSGQYLERKMPHARLQVIAGGEHSMHEDTHAGEVAAAIEQFLADGA